MVPPWSSVRPARATQSPRPAAQIVSGTQRHDLFLAALDDRENMIGPLHEGRRDLASRECGVLKTLSPDLARKLEGYMSHDEPHALSARGTVKK